MKASHGLRLTSTVRQGMTLLEVSVAAALLAVLISVSTQFLRASAAQQRSAERRVVALQTVQALAEQISNLPPEQLTADIEKQIAIPAAAAPFLPGARLAVEVVDEQESPAAKRVSISLTWNGPRGEPTGPVRVTTWVFADAAASTAGREATDD